MTLPAVRAFGLGKSYLLGERARMRMSRREQRTEFWALRDIDFVLEAGTTMGIIGHNGAGKSTLLKILSRVTAPTTGGIDLHGRVGALLEVGTGFHGELTGAENVYLNGALLGMRRSEVARHFEEIVEFAEVGAFIDTPVKRYSSGMYMRLAFAVAAHLEPEILIVDEVLSVGDLAFQEKCLGRMQQVARGGRTVIFVSHNAEAVTSLCERAMLLEAGTLVTEGPTSEVLEQYVRAVRAGAATRLDRRSDRLGSGRLRFTEVEYETNGVPTETVRSGDDLIITVRYDTGVERLREATFSVGIHTVLGRLMLNLDSAMLAQSFRDLSTSGSVRCHIPALPLPAGSYTVTLYAESGGEVLDLIERAAPLDVVAPATTRAAKTLPASLQSVLIDYGWARD
jgi:lipopolysaccharide transport system ATP-binding protein